jgi:hypothetical protein
MNNSMKSSQSKQSPANSKKKWLLACVIILISVAVVIGAWASTYQNSKNHAQDTAAPLEAALVKAGAVKKCGYGDAGKGSDNQRPWYNSFYELPSGRDKAIETVNSIAHENGYDLTHASKVNRGGLGAIADEFIDNWYFDNSKAPTYGDLQTGNINIAFGVNNDGQHSISNISCGTKDAVTINSGENSTMITLSVKLPEFKH